MSSYFTESEYLELKERFTENILRSTVAFLNSEGGQIIIGINDKGDVVGVSDVDDALKKISDMLTMQIEPNPQDIVTINLRFAGDRRLIAINVPKGPASIYCIRKYGFSTLGCLMRIGSTNRSMTPEQIRIRYEKAFYDDERMLKVSAKYGDITFRALKIYYSEHGFHLDDNSFEVNFNLRNDSGNYNLLAELLSDRNNVPMIFVKFRGDDKASISERSDYGNGCILVAYEKLKNRLIAENICRTDTSLRPRRDTYLFDMDCVDEALINAIVHNDWTQTEPLVSMFNDRIEILSHGGLPKGLTEEEFFSGISKPRNATLMRIFLNMGISEHTGHGIPTIVKRYGKQAFEITDNYIRCTIPFSFSMVESADETACAYGSDVGLTRTEKSVLKLLVLDGRETAESISSKIDVSKRTVERALSSLQGKKYLERVGSRRDGYWLVIR